MIRILFMTKPQEGSVLFCDHAQQYFGAGEADVDIDEWLEGDKAHQVLIENMDDEEDPMTEESPELTYDQAVGMLVPGDTIHTFISSPMALIGADWDRADVLELIKKKGAEKAGEAASAMRHGIAVLDHDDKGTPLFLRTRQS